MLGTLLQAQSDMAMAQLTRGEEMARSFAEPQDDKRETQGDTEEHQDDMVWLGVTWSREG